MNPGKWLGKQSDKEKLDTSNSDVDKFFKLREIEGTSDKWLIRCKRWIIRYLEFVNWKIDEDMTLQYLIMLKDKYSQTTYRKRVYQIKKYLTYLGIEWANNIKLPSELNYQVQRITKECIQDTLEFFNDNIYYIQIKALVYLGISSGLRAEELYQLTIKDIDLENRIIYINHNPNLNQTTKTKTSRISFFNNDAKQELKEYLNEFNNGSKLKCLFNQSHISRLFRNAPIRVKDLRKHFSQEWARRGGSTGIKKILMGHSLKGDVDLQHYNCQSKEDLKMIYDKVMGD